MKTQFSIGCLNMENGSNKYLIQDGDSLLHEKTLMRVYLQREDCIQCNIKDVANYPNMIPVGSVDFVNAYAAAHNIAIPDNMSYPDSLKQYLYRDVCKTTFRDALDNQFVKPIKIKEFTGAIKSSLSCIDPSCPVFASNPVNFMFEYRFYVVNGQVVGFGRYDDSFDDDFNCSLNELWNLVEAIIASFTEAPAGYSIDIGYDGNKWMIVEINDGWALGLYNSESCMHILDYITLITERWNQISHAL